MKLRHPLAALAAAALAVAALTGCQTNVGTAAHVDDQSIAASVIDDNVRTLSADELALLDTSAAVAASSARNVVTTFSVRDVLLERVWDLRGGQPSGEELDAVHDRAIQYLFADSTVPGGAEGDALVRSQLTLVGVDPDFGATMMRSTERLLVLADEIDAPDDAAIIEAVNDAGVSVRINPRLGSWDATTLSLAAPELPSFLRIPGSQSVAATS